MGNFGHFEGEVITRWLANPNGDDRNMELLQPFVYVDPKGKRWEAPAGLLINGATIPRLFWTTTGSPFVGNYRLASVVHDAACVAQTEPSAEVHRMFYYAMRCGGVKLVEAVVMYFAVKTWGPWWEVGVAPKAAMTLPPPPEEADILRIHAAAEKAVAELGEDATLEELEAKMGDNSRRFVPPELQ